MTDKDMSACINCRIQKNLKHYSLQHFFFDDHAQSRIKHITEFHACDKCFLKIGRDIKYFQQCFRFESAYSSHTDRC